jgi:competence protein ComEC
LLAERERWVLWTPVLLALGIGGYFAFDSEPPRWLGAVAAWALMLATALLARAVPALRASILVAGTALTLVAGGFAAVQLRTAMVAAPLLERTIAPATVSGRVVSVEPFPDGQRVVLAHPSIAGLDAERTPRLVRLRLRGDQPLLRPADEVRVPASVSPPPAPSAPGGFDFQRQAFFQRLGAVGYAIGRAEILGRSGDDDRSPAELALSRLRFDVAERIRRHVDGPAGAIIVALVVGDQSGIPKTALTAMRDSGLAHILSISGLHFALIAGFLFVGIRTGLALVPSLALRYPIKKWAAVVSLAGAGVYTLLAGAPVPAQRAFLMLAVVLVAILVDRRGISMRLVAFAAFVILAVEPESLVGPSFQMSFAAVVALVATYEQIQIRRIVRREDPAWWTRPLGYVAAVALTTVVASTATAPYAAYHFNRVTWYGVVANILAVPITGFWIMPLAVVAVVLMPFGAERLALVPMGWGIDVMLRIAEAVASMPGAISRLPMMSTAALVSLTIGGLWICLWQRRWRWWGGVGIVAGIALMLLSQPPDVLVEGRGKLFAIRTEAGDLALSSRNAGRLTQQAWLQDAGEETAAEVWPKSGEAVDGRLRCDGFGCIFRPPGHVVAFAKTIAALDEDCRVADIVISTVPMRRSCPSARYVIDRFDLWHEGAHALWLRPDGVRIETVARHQGTRPWVAKPVRRRSARGADDGDADADDQ